MLFATVVSLFFALLSAQESQPQQQNNEQKLVAEVEVVEGLGGCGCGKPVCLNPIVHYQNYQDVNVDVKEYYNYETTFPAIGDQLYAWTELALGGASQNNGLFVSGSPVNPAVIGRNIPVKLEAEKAVYLSAQMDFSASNGVDITSPLGFAADPFYGNGFLRAFDSNSTGLEFAFILTDQTVYAIYGRSDIFQSPSNDYISFRYLVPIATRQDASIYTLIFNKDEMSTTWMIDGVVRFVIPTAGKLIDERFAIEVAAGTLAQSAYPTFLDISMGVSSILGDGIPHSACQEAIFDYCQRNQTILLAQNVECTYEPVQDPTTYTINLELVVSMFSLVEASTMKPACSCPCLSK